MFKRLQKLFALQGYGLFVICILLVGIGLSLTAPYLALFSTDVLGMSAGAFGVFMAATSLSGVIVNSFIAKRSDNSWDRKYIIVFAMLASALGYASYLVFDHYLFLLIIVSILNGLGAPAMPQIYASAQESATSNKSEDKTFAMSTLRSLFSLGFLVGPLFGTVILSLMGYEGLFLGTSAIFFTSAVLVFLFLRKRVPAQHIHHKNKSPVFSLNKKHIRLPILALTFLFVVNSINWITTPLFIVNELHGSHTDVGLVVSICAGLEIPIMLMLGALAKKISNQSLMIYGCFVAVAYYIILSLSSHIWQIIAAQLLQATFIAIVMGNGLSYFNDLLPGSPGVAATIYSNAMIIGRLLGNLSGGFIAEAAGFRNVYPICLAVVVISLFILRQVKSKEKEALIQESRSI